jgi:hypothetical protein
VVFILRRNPESARQGDKLKRLLALLLFTLPAFAQTAIPLQNPSFETFNPLTGGNYNVGAPPSWTCSGTVGSYQPPASVFATIPDGKTVLWMGNGSASCSQDAGTVAANTYPLTVYIGNRAGFSAAWTILMLQGTTPLCSLASSAAPAIPVGTFAAESVSCSVPAGDLTVSISMSGSQLDVDDVSLTGASLAPPNIQSLTFNVGLFNCVKCDGTDYSALSSGSIYQGTSFSLAVQNLGANSPVCSGTLSATAQATCLGGVNVTPANVTFIITVTNPAGAQMLAPFAFLVPSFILQAAPTGNTNVFIGFDANTSAPRAGQVFTQ